MIIIFGGDSVRSFFPSRPQYAILGTGILGQIASFERRLRGAAQTSLALPYPSKHSSILGKGYESFTVRAFNFL